MLCGTWVDPGYSLNKSKVVLWTQEGTEETDGRVEDRSKGRG